MAVPPAESVVGVGVRMAQWAHLASGSSDAHEFAHRRQKLGATTVQVDVSLGRADCFGQRPSDGIGKVRPRVQVARRYRRRRRRWAWWRLRSQLLCLAVTNDAGGCRCFTGHDVCRKVKRRVGTRQQHASRLLAVVEVAEPARLVPRPMRRSAAVDALRPEGVDAQVSGKNNGGDGFHRIDRMRQGRRVALALVRRIERQAATSAQLLRLLVAQDRLDGRFATQPRFQIEGHDRRQLDAPVAGQQIASIRLELRRAVAGRGRFDGKVVYRAGAKAVEEDALKLRAFAVVRTSRVRQASRVLDAKRGAGAAVVPRRALANVHDRALDRSVRADRWTGRLCLLHAPTLTHALSFERCGLLGEAVLLVCHQPADLVAQRGRCRCRLRQKPSRLQVDELLDWRVAAIETGRGFDVSIEDAASIGTDAARRGTNVASIAASDLSNVDGFQQCATGLVVEDGRRRGRRTRRGRRGRRRSGEARLCPAHHLGVWRRRRWRRRDRVAAQHSLSGDKEQRRPIVGALDDESIDDGGHLGWIVARQAGANLHLLRQPDGRGRRIAKQGDCQRDVAVATVGLVLERALAQQLFAAVREKVLQRSASTAVADATLALHQADVWRVHALEELDAHVDGVAQKGHLAPLEGVEFALLVHEFGGAVPEDVVREQVEVGSGPVLGDGRLVLRHLDDATDAVEKLHRRLLGRSAANARVDRPIEPRVCQVDRRSALHGSELRSESAKVARGSGELVRIEAVVEPMRQSGRATHRVVAEHLVKGAVLAAVEHLLCREPFDVVGGDARRGQHDVVGDQTQLGHVAPEARRARLRAVELALLPAVVACKQAFDVDVAQPNHAFGRVPGVLHRLEDGVEHDEPRREDQRIGTVDEVVVEAAPLTDAFELLLPRPRLKHSDDAKDNVEDRLQDGHADVDHDDGDEIDGGHQDASYDAALDQRPSHLGDDHKDLDGNLGQLREHLVQDDVEQVHDHVHDDSKELEHRTDDLSDHFDDGVKRNGRKHRHAAGVHDATRGRKGKRKLVARNLSKSTRRRARVLIGVLFRRHDARDALHIVAVQTTPRLGREGALFDGRVEGDVAGHAVVAPEFQIDRVVEEEEGVGARSARCDGRDRFDADEEHALHQVHRHAVPKRNQRADQARCKHVARLSTQIVVSGDALRSGRANLEQLLRRRFEGVEQFEYHRERKETECKGAHDHAKEQKAVECAVETMHEDADVMVDGRGSGVFERLGAAQELFVVFVNIAVQILLVGSRGRRIGCIHRVHVLLGGTGRRIRHGDTRGVLTSVWFDDGARHHGWTGRRWWRRSGALSAGSAAALHAKCRRGLKQGRRVVLRRPSHKGLSLRQTMARRKASAVRRKIGRRPAGIHVQWHIGVLLQKPDAFLRCRRIGVVTYEV